MMSSPSPTASEARVLRWFLVAFFALALLLIAATWWRKSQACTSTCAAQGQTGSELKLAGGGRFGMSTQCSCTTGTAAK